MSAADKARRKFETYDFRSISIHDLHPDYAPVRTPSQDAADQEQDELLKRQIQERGIEVPLVVTRIPWRRHSYRVVDGGRRYKAAQELGLPVLPCQVFPVLTRAQFELLRWDSQHAKEPMWSAKEEGAVFRLIDKVRVACGIVLPWRERAAANEEKVAPSPVQRP